MRTLLIWFLLALPAACHESYLSRDQARAIRTIAPIVLVQDAVSVTKYWTVRSIVFETHKTKDGKTYQVSREETTTHSDSFVSPADFRIQDDVLEVLRRNLSPRYEVLPFAGDAAALQGLIGTTKLHPRGKTFAEKLKETEPPGRVDAYLVVYGPSAALAIDVGESSPRSVGVGSAQVRARYAYYLIDGRSFEIIAATGAGLVPAGENTPRPVPLGTRLPDPYQAISPFVAGQFDRPPLPLRETDQRELRALLITLIGQRVPWELRYNGLLE